MITQKEFAQRRQRLLKAIEPNSIVVLAAAPECLRTGDTEYLYRQNSDFYYLTGFNEPEAVMVLAPGRKEGEYILFTRDRNPAAEVWVGERAGQEGAVKNFGADQAFSITTLHEKMPELLSNYQRVYYPIGQDANVEQQLMSWLKQTQKKARSGITAPNIFIDSQEILHDMRLRKSAAEIDLMRKAAQVSAAAHCRAMKACQPGMMEYEIQAELLYEFAKQNCYPPAYNSIVASGANACVLHYVKNDAKLKTGDLLLIDAAGECEYYAADITRTFPINGRFSDEQSQIYEIVLEAQKTTIDMIKPGVTWAQLQENSVRVITAGLLQLGILHGNLQKLLADKAYAPFYMHHFGHWLGLNVHDVGSYRVKGKWRPLEAGMVLTVEPGIYLRADKTLDKKWWNIGIRIEDDVLVTAKGHDVLSKDVPKEIAAIEKLMQEKL